MCFVQVKKAWFWGSQKPAHPQCFKPCVWGAASFQSLCLFLIHTKAQYELVMALAEDSRARGTISGRDTVHVVPLALTFSELPTKHYLISPKQYMVIYLINLYHPSSLSWAEYYIRRYIRKYPQEKNRWHS